MFIPSVRTVRQTTTKKFRASSFGSSAGKKVFVGIASHQRGSSAPVQAYEGITPNTAEPNDDALDDALTPFRSSADGGLRGDRSCSRYFENAFLKPCEGASRPDSLRSREHPSQAVTRCGLPIQRGWDEATGGCLHFPVVASRTNVVPTAAQAAFARSAGNIKRAERGTCC